MVTSFILDTKGANVAVKCVRRVIMDGAMIAAPLVTSHTTCVSLNLLYIICTCVPGVPRKLALFDLRWLPTVFSEIL